VWLRDADGASLVSNLLFLLVPIAVAATAVTIMWLRSRPATSPTAGIDQFSVQMRALAPEDTEPTVVVSAAEPTRPPTGHAIVIDDTTDRTVVDDTMDRAVIDDTTDRTVVEDAAADDVAGDEVADVPDDSADAVESAAPEVSAPEVLAAEAAAPEAAAPEVAAPETVEADVEPDGPLSQDA
jgi:hypothetical protein